MLSRYQIMICITNEYTCQCLCFVFVLPIAGMLGVDEFAVVYPPNGVIPFHGFAMFGKHACSCVMWLNT